MSFVQNGIDILVNSLVKFGYDESIAHQIAEVSYGSTKGLVADSIPQSGWHDWVAPNLAYPQIPKEIQVRFKKLTNLSKGVRTLAQMKIERSYGPGWRNVQDGHAVSMKLKSILWDVPLPEHVPSLEEMRLAMILAGLGRTKGADLTDSNIASIKPPRPMAGIGVTINPRTGRPLSGYFEGQMDNHKGGVRNQAISVAMQFLDYAYKHDLKWDDLYDYVKVRKVLTDLSLVIRLALRTDGNPKNPRIIWIGNYGIYILETCLVEGIKQDMKLSHHFGYHTDHVFRWLSENRDLTKISGDISRWDLSQSWKAQANAWRAWGELYHLPVAPMVLCAMFNIFAPPIVPTRDGASIVPRRGIQPSGTGAFVIVNNILNLTYQFLLSVMTGCETVPLIFGDDFVTSSSYGAKEWAALAARTFGIRMKAEEQTEHRDWILFLRRFFHVENWSKEGHFYEPVIRSRAKNALFPTSSSPDSRHPAVIALAGRAQTAELYYAAMYSGKRAYDDIMEFWLDEIVPYEQLLLESYSDNELGAMIPDWGWEVRDSLTYIKRALNVDELGKFLIGIRHA